VSAKRLIRDRSGASAVEFALVAPLFLILLFAIWEFGWALHNAASVNYALEEASRDLMLDPSMTAAQLQKKVQDKVTRIGSGTVSVTLVRSTAGDVNFAEATSTYVHELMVPFVPKDVLTLRSTVTVVVP
jgi:Flp pilus assembly protein TadG